MADKRIDQFFKDNAEKATPVDADQVVLLDSEDLDGIIPKIKKAPKSAFVGPKGDKGDPGEAGLPGEPGIDGQDAPAWYTDMPAEPQEGDFWIDVSDPDNRCIKRYEAGLWPVFLYFTGCKVAPRDPVVGFVPDAGSEKDPVAVSSIFINSVSGDIFRRELSSWTLVGNIKGPAGLNGVDGAPGEPGLDGMDGQGVPEGGMTGQVLKKKSVTDFDTEWADESGGGSTSPFSETSGEITKVNGNAGINLSYGLMNPQNKSLDQGFVFPSGGFATGDGVVRGSGSVSGARAYIGKYYREEAMNNKIEIIGDRQHTFIDGQKLLIPDPGTGYFMETISAAGISYDDITNITTLLFDTVAVATIAAKNVEFYSGTSQGCMASGNKSISWGQYSKASGKGCVAHQMSSRADFSESVAADENSEAAGMQCVTGRSFKVTQIDSTKIISTDEDPSADIAIGNDCVLSIMYVNTGGDFSNYSRRAIVSDLPGGNQIELELIDDLPSDVMVFFGGSIVALKKSSGPAGYTVARGVMTRAWGLGSRAEGMRTVASKDLAYSRGVDTKATAFCSESSGLDSIADIPLEQVYSAGKFSSIGDAQRRQMIIRGESADDTPVDLAVSYTDPLSMAPVAHMLAVPQNTTWKVTADIVAMTATGLKVLTKKITFTVVNDMMGVSILGSVTTLSEEKTAALSWTAVPAIVGAATDGLTIQCTGEVAESIRWMADMEIRQLQYQGA